jgi:S-ribosylhomocysteine lyase LuxS involved in autoinducer biosynthesis
MAPGKETGLGGAVKFVVRTFLEQDHYRQLHRVLAKEWEHCHSLTAAVRLMEAHDIKLSQKEQERLQALPEDKMIDALVTKMPQQTREQFEHFFLQLSLIASTTTRLRAALEAGNTETIEEVLDAAENVGILSFILKMAVTQAGNEVMQNEANHDQWLHKTDENMAPLLRGQADAMISQKALAQARAQLNGHRIDANEKSRKVLMGIIGGQADALRSTCFSCWADITSRMKKENEIRKEYEDQIEEAERRLFEYRQSQLTNVRSVVERQAREVEGELVARCFRAFIEEVEEKKFTAAAGKDIAELEGKLKSMADAQSDNAKKVLGRMNNQSDVGLQTFVFQAWQRFCEEYNKNKEMEDAIKTSEQKVAQFMKQQNDGAKSVLNRMSMGNDTGLVATIWKNWNDWIAENKRTQELQELLQANAAKMSDFTGRNKGSAKSAMQRAAEAQEIASILIIFMYWKKEAKVQAMRRYGKEKNSKRKEQLQGVKGLFKNFANELDGSLKAGTPRIEPKKKGRSTSTPPKDGYPSPKGGDAPA